MEKVKVDMTNLVSVFSTYRCPFHAAHQPDKAHGSGIGIALDSITFVRCLWSQVQLRDCQREWRKERTFSSKSGDIRTLAALMDAKSPSQGSMLFDVGQTAVECDRIHVVAVLVGVAILALNMDYS